MSKDTPYTMRDYLDVLRRRWVVIATLFPASILLGVYLAYALPPLYRSSATIMLEPSSIPEDILRSTVTAYADQQLDLVRRRVLTTDNLTTLVDDLDPYPNRRDLSVTGKAQLISDDTLVERVDPITLEPLTESNAFSIHYVNPDPQLAKHVTEHLADMFLSHNRASRTEQATATKEYFQAESVKIEQNIRKIESELAKFEEEHDAALPESQLRNKELRDRTERDLVEMERQILTARDRQRLLEVQLASINPHLFDPEGDWRIQRQEMEGALALALQKYSAEHPDVKALRRAIAGLADRAASESRNTPPNNPEYNAVASQLRTERDIVASLEANAARARAQIDEYERSIQLTPEVERLYRQLTRRYDTEKTRYLEVQQGLSAAEMGQSLETEQRGDRLTLIRRPNTPRVPDSPNRLGIILLGFLLGGGLSVGLAAVMESSDSTVRNTRDLGDITDIKPLATVPIMLNAADRRRRVLGWSAASLMTAALLIVVGSTVLQAL
jgi:polysaccharide chain length determinant protein (PEP-CTERM system associated)